MVSSKPAEEEDNGVCGLPPMQYNYIVGYKVILPVFSTGLF